MTEKKKKKPGPKPKPIDLEQAYKSAKEGKDNATIAKDLGRAPNPEKLANLSQANPELRQAINRGRKENIEEHVKQVVPMAQWALKEILSNPNHPGFTAATLFVHKTQMGFRETAKVEVSGEIQHIHQLSPEDRQKRIQELKKELTEAIDVELVTDDTSGT